MHKASSHVGPKRNMQKHASIASRTFLSNMHKASSHVGQSETCENMPASLPERFYQTCTASSHMRNMPAPLPQSFHQTCTSTRPLPTLGQSQTCETCQHRFQNVSIKHAETGQPRFQNIYRMCTRSLHTLSQSDQTIHRYITKRRSNECKCACRIEKAITHRTRARSLCSEQTHSATVRQCQH